MTKKHAEELLEGTASEAGRIGYVAVTRARNLFLLAIPENAFTALVPKLIAIGLKVPN
jgi:hypothetical protein